MNKNLAAPEAVSRRATWKEYYAQVELTEASGKRYDEYFEYAQIASQRPGVLFELGCGGSAFLAQAAKRGWHVGGIDYYQDALNILESFLDATGRKHGIFINDDVFTFDWNSIRESVDLIASFGFLEHFKNPDQILLNASLALKPGGLVLSQIPNLFSFNAKLFKKYDRELWDQHVPYDPEQMDRMHTNAGLEIVEPASFRGGFDQYMLTPWEKIGERMPFIAYKGVRYFASYLVQPVMRLMPKTGKKSYCANVVGVYRKPTG